MTINSAEEVLVGLRELANSRLDANAWSILIEAEDDHLALLKTETVLWFAELRFLVDYCVANGWVMRVSSVSGGMKVFLVKRKASRVVV